MNVNDEFELIIEEIEQGISPLSKEEQEHMIKLYERSPYFR